jgi:hypothetical protein
MTRTVQDRNFLVWEIYPSGGRHGYSRNPHLIFNCLTQPNLRPRWIAGGGDEAEAPRVIAESTDARLLELLEGAVEIP